MLTGLGEKVRRVEDPPLVTGAARYTEDLVIPGALNAAFVRSVMAHARITRVDTGEAAGMPGVVEVLTATDLGLPPMGPGLGPPELARPPLASDVVRFIGEAVAVVVADTREHAVDAAEAVVVDYDPLPVVTDPAEAVRDDAPSLFPDRGNVAVEVPWKGDSAKVEEADVVVRARMVNQRVNPAPMEPSAEVAAPDPETGGVVVWAQTQAPFFAKAALCTALGLDGEKVRVVAPVVGGAFGARIVTYPEQVVVAALALRLERPVRYVETRSETMLSMSHGRGQVQEVELGATADGVITDLRVRIIADGGAYPGEAALMPGMTVMMLCGPYRIQRVEGHTRTVATNSSPVAAYRGAGRPEATWLLERMIDQLARQLGLDPAEVRRRNLLPPDSFPYDTVAGARYDSGDYTASLDRVLELAGYDALRAEQAARRERGDRLQLGIGLSTYVEITGFGAEMGAVTVERDGSVTVVTGVSPHGQGHETAWAQLVSSTLGVELEQVRVVHSDTAKVPSGSGTMGSRSLQVGGSAVFQASEQVLTKGRELAAHLLEARVEDVVVHNGHGLGVAGVPATELSGARLAEAAADPARRPDGFASGDADGSDGVLTAQVDFEMEGSTFPFGAHVAVVEVDVETGLVRLVRHVAVDDSGRLVNPLLAEGQVQGGIAQGAGQALYEEVRYDRDGNNLTGSFASYTVPSAAELPSFETARMETPSPLNPLGAKGIGESGAIGSTPAIHNAVVDALAPYGVTDIEMPTTPERVWRAIEQGRAQRSFGGA
jgi:aerobic carbon-monoxide dehydrogenase large subunit